MNVDYLEVKRKQLGMTYRELSERSGVSYNTICKVFQGIAKSPQTKTIYALEKALGVIRAMPEAAAPVYDEDILITYYRRLPPKEKIKLFGIMQIVFDLTNDLPLEEVSEYLNTHKKRGIKD